MQKKKIYSIFLPNPAAKMSAELPSPFVAFTLAPFSMSIRTSFSEILLYPVMVNYGVSY